MLMAEKRADWRTIIDKLMGLPEFKKLKLA